MATLGISDIISITISIAEKIIDQLDKIEENCEIKYELLFRVKIIRDALKYILKEDENLEIVKNIKSVLNEIEEYIIKRDEDNDFKRFIFAKKINDNYKKLILLLDSRISQVSLLMTIKSRKSIEENFDELENKLDKNGKNIENRLKNILNDINESDKNVSMRVLGITSIGQKTKLDRINIENEYDNQNIWKNIADIANKPSTFNGINMDVIGNTAIGGESIIKEIIITSSKKEYNFQEEENEYLR